MEDVTIVPAIIAWLGSIGLTTRVTLRADSESSLMDVIRAVSRTRDAETIVETIPIRSSSSIGCCDIRAQMTSAQVRALRLDVQRRFSIWLPVTHPSFGWLLWHASFVLDRFQPSRPRSGLTAFEIMHGKIYDQELTAFGAIGMGRNPVALAIPKGEPRWFLCSWMGRTVSSSDHILATEAGIRYSRSFKL